MSRKIAPTIDGSAAIDGHSTAWYFVTDGTNDPSEMSGNIESVTRFTADGPGPEAYRVRFCDPQRYDGQGAIGEAYTVVQLQADDLRAVRVLDALNAGEAPDPDREIDILVKVANTGVATNQVAAGRYVKSMALLDLSSFAE